MIERMIVMPTVALVALSALGASALADASTQGTRGGYVVGGELVTPPQSTVEPTSENDASDGETRHGYVVGGELVRPR